MYSVTILLLSIINGLTYYTLGGSSSSHCYHYCYRLYFTYSILTCISTPSQVQNTLYCCRPKCLFWCYHSGTPKSRHWEILHIAALTFATKHWIHYYCFTLWSNFQGSCLCLLLYIHVLWEHLLGDLRLQNQWHF